MKTGQCLPGEHDWSYKRRKRRKCSACKEIHYLTFNRITVEQKWQPNLRPKYVTMPQTVPLLQQVMERDAETMYEMDKENTRLQRVNQSLRNRLAKCRGSRKKQ